MHTVIGHSMNFSVWLVWINFITEPNDANVREAGSWTAVCFSQSFSDRLFKHLKPTRGKTFPTSPRMFFLRSKLQQKSIRIEHNVAIDYTVVHL